MKNRFPPDISFSTVHDSFLRDILCDYYEQARKALDAEAYLGAVVSVGAVVEGLLTFALSRHQFAAKLGRANARHEDLPLAELRVLMGVQSLISIIRCWRCLSGRF